MTIVLTLVVTEFVSTAADRDAGVARGSFGVVGTRSSRLSEPEIVVRAHVHRPTTLTRQTVNRPPSATDLSLSLSLSLSCSL